MKKKIVALFIGAMALCLGACGDNTEGDSSKKETTMEVSDSVTSDNDGETVEETEKATQEKTTNDEKASKEAEDEALREKLENTKVSVLATAGMPYDDAMINGYGYATDDYDTATIVTLLIEFPDDSLKYYFEKLDIYGDAVTAADGEIIPHTYSGTAWWSDDDKNIIMLMRVAGDVDTTTFGVKIEGEMYDTVTVEKEFENNGNPVGFEYAKTCFSDSDSEEYGLDSLIIKLMNRHYFILKRYENTYASSYGAGDIHSYILIPLEGGFTRTLTTDDVTVECDATAENTTYTVSVNESGVVEQTCPKFQTTVDVDVLRAQTAEEEAILEEDSRNEEVWSKIRADRDIIFDNIVICIDDGEGNQVRLNYK